MSVRFHDQRPEPRKRNGRHWWVTLRPVVWAGLWGCVLALRSLQAEESSLAGSSDTLLIPRVLVTPISEIEVPAQATGALAEVLVKVGDLVEAGTLLARIDDTEAAMAEGVAEVEWEIAGKQAEGLPLVQAAEEAAEVARRNLARAEQSLKDFQRSISQAEMDEYRLKAIEAKASLWERRQVLEISQLNHQLRAKQLDQAKDQTRRHQIVSPAKGMVKEIVRDTGEWMIPGQPLARVLRLDRLRCVGFLPADRVRDLEDPSAWLGLEATLWVPSAEDPQARRFTGKITFLDPEIEPESDQVRIWVEIDNADLKLRPGDRGTLRIDLLLPATD